MKGYVRVYIFTVLFCSGIFPVITYILDGFKTFSYSPADYLHSIITLFWFVVVLYHFKKYNKHIKLVGFIVAVILGSLIPEHLEQPFSMRLTLTITVVTVIASLIYYLTFIKGKVDKKGFLISTSQEKET